MNDREQMLREQIIKTFYDVNSLVHIISLFDWDLMTFVKTEGMEKISTAMTCQPFVAVAGPKKDGVIFDIRISLVERS